ncbi:unnamed protein product [Cyprideis torosa]|uniref:FAD synthase n=1 Tax=Cyprideis torosa TaxID=163714 RepID=A0A7R8W4W9_9CRUS|nr:unnamed protein product [Cyprideis torosa]CAG0884659.1 unnamed protein product [Cyprideis torosa]
MIILILRPEEVVLFFNGGKDCTVALHVLHAYLQHHHPEARKNLKVAYIREEAPFPEMQEFISDTTKRYNLKLRVLSGPLRSGLETLLSEDPQIKAGVMGTRFGDPYSESQTEFQPTDSGWPPLMRVNPLLRWSYGEVWEYLRSLSVHYCSLYDRGYSSIGCVARTLRNPKLLQTLPDGRTEYRPAYELTDFHEERAGRIGCKSGENS